MNFPLSNEIDRERLHAMKVLVVDDHPLFLSGIRGVLESLADDVSVLEAGSAEDAIEHIQRAGHRLHLPRPAASGPERHRVSRGTAQAAGTGTRGDFVGARIAQRHSLRA